MEETLEAGLAQLFGGALKPAGVRGRATTARLATRAQPISPPGGVVVPARRRGAARGDWARYAEELTGWGDAAAVTRDRRRWGGLGIWSCASFGRTGSPMSPAHPSVSSNVSPMSNCSARRRRARSSTPK